MSDITAAVLEPKNELICKIHIVVDSGLCEQNPYLSKSNMPDRTKEKLWPKIVARVNMLHIYPGKWDQCGKKKFATLLWQPE